MSNRIIEGAWEEIIQRDDLRGRRVRVVVVDEPTRDPTEGTRWVSQLRAWVEGHPSVNHIIDDSREGIYDGTIDDPR